jgi:hypothetical protein
LTLALTLALSLEAKSRSKITTAKSTVEKVIMPKKGIDKKE